jgi:hypothetical protein
MEKHLHQSRQIVEIIYREDRRNSDVISSEDDDGGGFIGDASIKRR